MKWWNKPLRISAVQCNYGADSFEILKNKVISGFFNTEQLLHLTAEGHMSFYEEAVHGKLLDKYLKEAHDNDIMEIIYINVHCLVKKYRDAHPDWIQLDVNGKEVMAYDLYYFNCVNGGWYDYFEDNLKKLCSHDINGIFLDGPVMVQSGCYCKACQEKFKAIYKKSIFDADSHELMEFKVDSVTEYIKKSHAAVKKINPDILIYLNNSALRADVTGSNTRKVYDYVDMLGAEGGFVWVDKNTSLNHAGSMAKYIDNQAEGKPTVIFFAGDHKPHSYLMHTEAETRIIYSQSIANGANVWYGIHGPIDMMKTKAGKAAIEMNKFHSENEEYYNNTKPVSNIALVWSMESANYYSSSVAETDFTKKETLGSSKAAKGNHYKAFMGFYEMLTRSHAQFDVIDDVNLKTSDLGKYEMLILPTCGCMSQEVLSGLKKYVKNGGKVLSTYDTGFYSGKGTYKGPDEISDLLGIKGIREVVRYNLSGTAYQKVSNSSYNNELDYHLIPAPELALRCDAADGAKVDTEFLEPMPGRYVALPEEGFPGIIVNSYGSGKSIYICGTLGEYYYEKTHPSLRQLLSGILDKETSALLRTNAPGSVEMVLRKKDSDIYILHAVNMTGDMTRPIERILPVTDINVTIRSEKAPISIKSLMSGMEIPFTFDKSAINFVIDKIDYYEPLVISFA